MPFTVHGKAILAGKIRDSTKCTESQSVNSVTILNVSSSIPLQILESGENVDEANAFDVARELNSYESLGIHLQSRDEDDRQALDIFNSKLQYDANGRPTVGFPWKNSVPPSQEELDTNHDVVRTRFEAVMKSLDKNQVKLAQYEAVHKQEVALGFIELAPLSELNDPLVVRHYINHFPVFKSDPNATTKCRRVFDASMHKRGKLSLNDTMLKGSQMTPHILEVSLRLRLLEFLLTADISKAYMRMSLRELERNFTCFYARRNFLDPDSEIQVWRFRSVIFGASSSPFLLNCTVADILQHNQFSEYLEVFVDNLFVLLSESKGIFPSVLDAIRIFGHAGMPLHEFACNVPPINKVLKEQGIFTQSKVLKVLGMNWDYEHDIWYVKGIDFELFVITKRSVLSDIARIYDPCGFLSPITVRARLLVQVAWESDLSWDELLPLDMQKEWREIVSMLLDALTVPIPRWVGFRGFKGVSIHCFTDASEKSLGVVIYLVGPNHSVMFMSKAKICPIKMAHFTIPRKELCAISLGARCLKFVMGAVAKYFTPVGVHLWSDACTAITWVVCKRSHRDLFIRSRVDDIVNKKDNMGFKVHYILGTSNPADLLTKRSLDPLRSALWLNGPDILQHPEQWQEYAPPAAKIDSVPIFCGSVAIQDGYGEDLPDVRRYDSLTALYAATAQASLSKARVLSCHITWAERKWVLAVQRKHYAEAFAFLGALDGVALRSVGGKTVMRSQKLSPPPICLSFHLVLDDHGMLRVQTSLANAPNLSYEQKCPLLLPAVDPFTELVIRHCHLDAGHMGLNTTRAFLRRRFWVPKVTCVIKRVVAACGSCRVERGKRYHVPHSPPLPVYRFNVEEPWAVTAVDMTGHEWISSGADGSVRKVYFIIFVCMSTGGGHIEMVPDASSASFANAFDRFCSRRGIPSMLLSDHGSNFRGYESELKALAFDLSLENHMFSKGIVWRWTPVGAPHFNGYVERQIGIIKSIMRKSIKSRVLSMDQLLTVACYAECMFNERPIAMMDADDVDFVPITPNSLIYGRSLPHFAHDVSEVDLNDPDFRVNNKSLNVMARKLKSTLALVRKTWVQEYLHFLACKDGYRQKMAPVTKSVVVPRVGDNILIKDGKDLRLGRIVELFPSDDGEVRSARILTKNGHGTFPVCHLRFLERGDVTIPPESDDLNPPLSDDIKPPVRTRLQRKAAADAQAKFLSMHLLARVTL